MKKILLTFILFALCLSFSIGQLAVKPEIYNFKPVKSGTIVNASFELYNAGEREIQITRISKSCGCTTISKKPDKLLSGESFNLKVSFNTSGYRGDVEKRIYIFTGTSEERKILKIKGNIIPKPSGLLEIKDKIVDFGLISKGSEKVKIVQISNVGQKELKILEVSYPPFFQVSFGKVKLKPGESTTLSITVLPLIYGKDSKTVKILTDAYYNRYKWFRVSYQVEE